MTTLDLNVPFAHHLRDKSTTLPRKDAVDKLDFESVEDTGSSASSVTDSSASRHSSDASSTDGNPTKDDREAKIAAAHTTYYPHPTAFKIEEKPIDEIRPLNVAIVGAGLSGITAGALLPAKVPGIKLTIFEKNADVGGTWIENTYPGVRCDIPAHVYQSSFEPNTQWSEEYAQGSEIRDYWQGLARKYDVYSKMQFSIKVTGSYWEPQRAQWRLEMNDASGQRSTEYFDFVIQAIGRFNNWKMPDYPGIEKYKGKLCHSSNWDSSFDATNKRIATIGNGASGIQVTPALQKIAKHIDHYARSPTWIAGKFTPWLKERQEAPIYFSKEAKTAFEDPDIYLLYRKKVEDGFWRTYAGIIADSDTAKALPGKLSSIMKKRLEDGGRPDFVEKLVPDFPPHCRRLTPGPGYLECLTKDNVELIMTPMERFTEDGIVTVDGVHRPVDAVICSTGANTDCAPPVPIVAGDFDLSKDWKPEGKFGFPYSYLGIGVPGFPNMAFILGPNPAGPTGTLVNSAETQIAYIAKMLRKISSQGIKTITPSRQATDEFIEYCDAFFPRTNLTKMCSSWSNGGVPGARIHGHWPGSAAHLNLVRREPRWEDWEYTYIRPENRFAYFGNGWTKREKDLDYDMVSYLRKWDQNDLRNLHELWWDL